MEKSLRDWCRESLKFCCAYPDVDGKNGGFVDAERRVDAAAFLTLLNVHGISFDDAVARADLEVPAVTVVDEQLYRTCPLSAGSPIEILGEIHEFLVSLRTEPSGSLNPGAKPRTVNGIFYTPKYIADEIVQKTLGSRLKSATFSQAKQITILDPAAGCGAFLVAAYRALLDWHLSWQISNLPVNDARDIVLTRDGSRLTFNRCQSILANQLFGVDLDPAAIEVLRRSLWMIMVESSAPESLPDSLIASWDNLRSNFKMGHALIGHSFADGPIQNDGSIVFSGGEIPAFDWRREFPQVFEHGGFDLVIGNPPYRRERDFKHELDKIGETPFGQRHRSARMDLWYYFVHRGIDLLKSGGSLSFITNSYWLHGKGSDKLIATLRDDVHLDELFLLRNQRVFSGVSGQHVILRLTKSKCILGTRIKIVPQKLASSAEPFITGEALVNEFMKSKQQLFRDEQLDVLPPVNELLDILGTYPPLSDFGMIRQGIAENPATINRRTLDRFRDSPESKNWLVGEGVFSLQGDEVARLLLEPDESKLLRPYHDLCDLDRYWAASSPSRQLIFSTRQTCPEIMTLPQLRKHLERFRPILEARRETIQESNRWWHLHWPRDERIWQSDKLVALQMAIRPSFVPIRGPAYVPFSANVFVPAASTREDLRYFCGVLNSNILWAWFEHHAKRRGVGLEVNGRTLERAPIRRIDFDDVKDVRRHDELVELVDFRIGLSLALTTKLKQDAHKSNPKIQEVELRIESVVGELYGLGPAEMKLVDEITTCNDR